MNIKHNWVKIIITVFYFFSTFCHSQGMHNMRSESIIQKSIRYTKDATSNRRLFRSFSIKDIIPDCVFGVKSVSYVLYTRDKPTGRVVYMQDEQIPLRSNVPVGFFIHGFINTFNYSNYFELINIWLHKEDINIFSVNWDDAACTNGFKLADLLSYESAVKNVPIVGQNIANFTARLTRDFGVNISEIILIGHSLGAHIAGYAGKTIQRLIDQKYYLIIGLDPAGPSFYARDCADRLCKSDAAFVEIYHTSILEGLHTAIGDYDFYFHGGFDQPACILPICHHSIAVIYASMSIQYPKCFIGTHWQLDSKYVLSSSECNSYTCSYAGLKTPMETAKGIFYVTVTSEKPYCSP